MKIETITFEFEQTILSTLTMSVEEGYVMPTTGKELVQLVNEISNSATSSVTESKIFDTVTELKSYDIKEAE